MINLTPEEAILLRDALDNFLISREYITYNEQSIESRFSAATRYVLKRYPYFTPKQQESKIYETVKRIRLALDLQKRIHGE